MVSESDPEERWNRVAAELRAHRQDQREAWGGLDDMTLARYIAGACSEDEARRVAETIAKPSVREALAIAREVFAEPVLVPPGGAWKPSAGWQSLFALPRPWL